jgi:hypothetical protein
MSLEHLNGVSPWTSELQETVRRLFAEGITAREIGRRVGMTKNQIIGWCDRQGLTRRARHVPTTLDRLRAYHDKLDAALAEDKSIPRIPPGPEVRVPAARLAGSTRAAAG